MPIKIFERFLLNYRKSKGKLQALGNMHSLIRSLMFPQYTITVIHCKIIAIKIRLKLTVKIKLRQMRIIKGENSHLH